VKIRVGATLFPCGFGTPCARSAPWVGEVQSSVDCACCVRVYKDKRPHAAHESTAKCFRRKLGQTGEGEEQSKYE
jgi:hypothetical protein